MSFFHQDMILNELTEDNQLEMLVSLIAEHFLANNNEEKDEGLQLTDDQMQMIEDITDNFDIPMEIPTERKRKEKETDDNTELEPNAKRHIPLEVNVIISQPASSVTSPEKTKQQTPRNIQTNENAYLNQLRKIRTEQQQQQQIEIKKRERNERIARAKRKKDKFKKKHEREERLKRAKKKKNEFLEIHKAKQELVVLMQKKQLQEFFHFYDSETDQILVKDLDETIMKMQAEEDAKACDDENNSQLINSLNEIELAIQQTPEQAADDEGVSDEDDDENEDEDEDDEDENEDDEEEDEDEDEEDDDDDDEDDDKEEEEEEEEEGEDDDDGTVNVIKLTDTSNSNEGIEQTGSGVGDRTDGDGNDVGPDNEYASGFKMKEKKTINRPKFGVKETIFEVTLTPEWMGRSWLSLTANLYDVFEKAIALASEGLRSDDRGRIYINQKGLESPILIHFRELKDITPEVILAEIMKILQSKQNLALTKSFTIHIGTVRILRGGHFSGNLKLDIKRKHSIFEIKNENDNLCCARAIWICNEYSKAEKLNSKAKGKMKQKLREYTGTRLKAEAIKLHKDAGVGMETGCGVSEIKAFERFLDAQIIVVSGDNLCEIEYRGTGHKQCKLFLLRVGTHFHAVVNIQGFYGRKYFCMDCIKPLHKKRHRCVVEKCSICLRQCCNTDHDGNTCIDCGVFCKNSECYRLHKEKPFNNFNKRIGLSYCETFWKCLMCKRLFERKDVSPDSHTCDDSKCGKCNKYHKQGHQCFIEKRNVNPPGFNYIFFDFECRQETGVHIPNLCVAQKTCKVCIGRMINDDNQHCEACGDRQMIFTDAETFCEWVFSPHHSKYTLVAHNMKGYDGYFLLAYLYKNAIKPELIFSGGKLMYMYVPHLKIRVIDSLNFIQSGLAKLPKTFGEVEIKKGYFPHLFNTEENQSYIGHLPHVSYYCVDEMSSKERKKFLHWHSEKSREGYIFDFQHELRSYCISDVDILRRCLLKFRQLLLNLTNTDPLQYITAASVCMAVYNSQFLKDQTLAKLPSDGLTIRDQYSRISIAWLEWIMHTSDAEIHIHHACNGGEQKVGKYRVDGLDKANKIVYEYHSCFYHGCPICYLPNSYNPKTKTSFENLHTDTENKRQYIEAAGFTYICMWDHDFREDIRTDGALAEFVDKLEIVERLNPRDAFFGGRTNAYCLYYLPKPDEKVQYVDFTSLYPYVNKYCKYPVGYPEVITSNFQDISEYFGLIQCKILPPRKLFHPVLPYRANGKLMFPLCRTCAHESFQGTCTHNNNERSLTGTWCTNELEVSLKNGYVIDRIYEVYHFQNTACYDPASGTEGLFTKYINTFLKIKQEASGWPSWCESDKDKDKYIDDYYNKEGIRLDCGKVCRNDGLRALAKLMFNSFWGRYGMRLNLPQTEVISNLADFHFLLADETKQVRDFHSISDDFIVMEWLYKDPFVPDGHNTNIFMACFTTAHARLRLYDEMSKLNDRVLYSDTDSLIYIHKDGLYNPSLGDYLGDLTSELTCKELECKDGCTKKHAITEFASGGPKDYAYKTDIGTEVCKVKGFSLNHKNSQLINFETVKDLVTTNQGKNIELTNENKICRDKKNAKIYNRKEVKNISFVTPKGGYLTI